MIRTVNLSTTVILQGEGKRAYERKFKLQTKCKPVNKLPIGKSQAVTLADSVHRCQVKERAKHLPLVLSHISPSCKRFSRDVGDGELASLLGAEDFIDPPGAEDEAVHRGG